MLRMKPALILASLAFIPLHAAMATVFYSDDFEHGIKYVGTKNAHPNGGAIIYLGGEVNHPINPGDGTQDYLKYNNVILDSSAEAANSIPGSQYSLKTQYKKGGTGFGYAGDFQLNTTIIGFPETDLVYVRWYQKWGKDWIWPRDQQKLLKIKGDEQSQNFKISFSKNSINLTKKSPPPYEYMNETYIWPQVPDRTPDTDWNKRDSDPTTDNYPLEKNKWYCIEVMVKSNTPGLNDAEFAYWIGGKRKFYYNNTNNRGTSRKGISHIELQHVVQDVWDQPRPNDTPTWMDNIVVANEPIGCGDSPPNPPIKQ